MAVIQRETFRERLFTIEIKAMAEWKVYGLL